MRTKLVALLLGTALFVVALFLALFSGERTREPGRTPPPGATPFVATTPPTVGQPPMSTPTSPNAATPPFPRQIGPEATTGVGAAATPAVDTNDPILAQRAAAPRDAQVDANKVHLMMRDYHTLMGENPVGTNAEIMEALMGKNPRQATVGPPEGMTLNGKGELVDQWGTPYFFHQLSRDIMEIHSAGPDKVMGTADDIVVR